MTRKRAESGAFALGTVLLCAILTAFGSPFLHAALTGLAMGLVLAVRGLNLQIKKWAWLAVATLTCVASIALLYENRGIEKVCEAKDASGKVRTIGTELTVLGKKYAAQNPTDGKDEIIASLGGLDPSTAWTAESIHRCQFRLFTTGLWMPMMGMALACLVAITSPRDTRSPTRGGRNVFISYSHQDASVAVRVQDELASLGLKVAIDLTHMGAGEEIQEFIKRSMKNSDAVVSIVSAQSLLSSWVAIETINAFNRESSVGGKLFVGALLDDEVFRPDFRLECTRTIDDRLSRVDNLIAEYRAQKIDSVDLNEEKTRLFDLRNNLGAILARLRGSLCVDLRDPHFKSSCAKLAEAVRNAGR